MNYKGYKDLECYKQAGLLRIFIADIVKKFPVFKLINGYIAYLDRSKQQTKQALKPNS